MTLRALPAFLAVGAVATALQYLILVAAVEFAGLGPTLASTIGFCAAAGANYWLNYHVTFASGVRHAVALRRFVLMVLVGLAINSGAMFVLTQVAGLQYLVAQVLATGMTLAWNFGASSRWTFRES